MSKGQKIALWAVSILLAAMFLFSGCFKLLQPAQAKAGFVQYGYAAWFATFIGVCEALGGLGLLLPRLAALAAGGLSIIMAGAVYTHFSHHEYQHGLIPLVLLALLVGVAYARVKEGKA
ncbi:MAG TPA: DoxX family protein [Candidatus Angelobacter sp.]|jgi:putative oxidoreductase